MSELISDRQWHSSPTLNYSISYEAERPDVHSTRVRVRFTIIMRSLYSSCDFRYPLYIKNSINNTEYTATTSFGSGIKSISYTTPWIDFESTGSSLKVGMTPRCGDASHTSYDEGTISFPAYVAQTAPVLTINSITEIGLNSMKVNYSHSGDFEHIQYSLNNGPWIQTYGSPSTIIEGLSPNTQYSVRLRGLNSDKTLIGNASNTKVIKTLDIGRITNLSNFEHGNNVSINITNPSKKSLNLEVNIGNTQIISQTVKEGQNTINFNDVMLDKIYKLYEKNDFLEVSFILKTNNKYTETKTCNIFLKGNQKNGYKRISGRLYRIKRYVKKNGKLYRVLRWKKENGKLRRCI